MAVAESRDTIRPEKEDIPQTPVAPTERVLMAFKDFDTNVEMLETVDMVYLEAQYEGGPLNSVGIPKALVPQVTRTLLKLLNGGE